MLAPLSLPWPPKRTHRWHPEDAKTALGYSRNSRRSTRQSYCQCLYKVPYSDREATRIGTRRADIRSTIDHLHTARASIETAITAA